MSRIKLGGPVAALSVLSLLAACTTASDDTDSPIRDEATPEASPAPEFHLLGIDESDLPAAQDSTTKPTATDAPTAPTTSAMDTGGVIDSGSTVDIEAGQRLLFAVNGGTLSDISLNDTDHPRISLDPGEFFNAEGTALDPAENADSSTMKPTSPEKTESPTAETSEADSSAVDSTSADKSIEKAEGMSAPDDSAAWISRFDLVADETYAITATATTPDGTEHEFTAEIEVGDTEDSGMSVRSVLADDQTVGVAAPIILTFDSGVAKKFRDDVEHRLSVKVTDKDGKKRKVAGSWGWLYDDPGSRLHFRPKEYWPAHSKISVDAPLKNVPTAAGKVGSADLTLDFEIGRKQIVKASATTHRMVVTRDGKKVMDFPTSLGSPQAPSHNGIHVVMSKAANYTMTSEQWDYETPVQWAVRIHNNGEFVHGAPWSAGSQGVANVSHGCINLTLPRAKEYYDSAIYGDPVIITGAALDLSTQDSDISDWVYDWDDWKKLSALD